MNVAINGFGRIGRLFFRQAFQKSDMTIVAINDLGDLENLAYLLQHDSVYHAYEKRVSVDMQNHALVVDGVSVQVLQEKDPTKLPWKNLNIDVVVECTGAFDSYEKSSAHITAGAKRVVISAPAKDDDGAIGKTVLMGINEVDAKDIKITSNGSCTTNACSPVMQVLHETIGIEKAILDTVHAYTATQSIVDSPVKGSDFRRGRAGAFNISPSSTGAALTVTKIIKDLAGKFDGVAVRVPVIAGSLADITFIAKRDTTKEEVNEMLKKASEDPRWKGILKVTEEQLASSDIIGEPCGAFVDLQFTKVVGGNLVKVFSWYDNEYGYTSLLVRHVLMLQKFL